MTDSFSPDPDRLAAARRAVHGYVDRKRRWTRILFVIACIAEMSLFGAMLFFFDFGERFYWFVFVGLCFIYSPLIVFIFRNAILLERAYWKLMLELKLSPEMAEAHGLDESVKSERDEARSFLEKKDRWAKGLFWLAGAFEGGLFFTMLWLMDFSSRLDWFLCIGFLAVYTPLIISTWRNVWAIDRLYYGLIDELKYGAPDSVEGGSAGGF